jgi:putative ABC transport system substrate-binding protein
MNTHPTRRAVLFAGAAAVIASRAAAEDSPIRRIIVVPWSADRSWPHWVAFEDELHHLGYTDGRNIGINYILRASEMSPPALTEAIAAQLSQGAGAIIASGSEHTLAAAAAATHTIPIVMIPLDYDPLAKGYIAGLAHPGGNITGVMLQTIEVTAKRLDLFKQAVPDMRRVAMLWDQNGQIPTRRRARPRRLWASRSSRSKSVTPRTTMSAPWPRRGAGRAMG